jgi:surface protein
MLFGTLTSFSCGSVLSSFFLAAVFYQASAFNGDLNQWNVAKVTTMSNSKSIRIVENDVNSCYCYWRIQSGVGVGVDVLCKGGREMVLKHVGYCVYCHNP